MRIFFIWVFLLSCSISHLESCMLSAVLFKDLCLSEEVPFIFSLSHSGMWTFKQKANFFTSITLDMLSQLYPQITVLEKKGFCFLFVYFLDMPGLSTLGLNLRPHNQFCGKTAHSPRFYFSLRSARQQQGTFSILCKSSKAAVFTDHVTYGSGLAC